jgi:hypothetical protein
MAMREAHPQRLALRATLMVAGHVRDGPRLVDEDHAFGIEIELAVEGALALLQDFGSLLLDSIWPVIISRHAAALKEAVKPGERDSQADSRQLCKRNVFAPLPNSKDVCRTLFDPA